MRGGNTSFFYWGLIRVHYHFKKKYYLIMDKFSFIKISEKNPKNKTDVSEI